MKVYLYRSRNAIGCATHWTRATGDALAEGYEFLGHGDLWQTPTRCGIDAHGIALADDIIDFPIVTNIAAHSDNNCHSRTGLSGEMYKLMN